MKATEKSNTSPPYDAHTRSAVAICLTIAWLAALVYASFNDLAISLAIANERSILGRTLEIAGEPPAILFTSFNFSLMCAYFLKREKRRAGDIVLAVLTLIGAAGTAVYTLVQTVIYIAEWMNTAAHPLLITAAVVIGLAIAAAFLCCVLRMRRETLERYFKVACHCALAAIATFLVIWAFKLCWGRVRFRQLEGDLSRFTAWYLPQGFTGYFSFPSGHTANAAVIFTVTYYLRFLPERHQNKKPLIYAALVVWVSLLAFSRVRVGAHYMSDVLCGAAITFAIVYLFRVKEKV